MESVSRPLTGMTSSHSTAVDRGKKTGARQSSSTKFARPQIRCVHHWMPGRILGLPLQCGEGRRFLQCVRASA